MNKLPKLILYLLLTVAIFFLLPLYLDQQLAAVPYDYTRNYFYGELALWCKAIYYSVNVVTGLLIILPITLFMLVKTRKVSANQNLVTRMLLISYLSLSIGPGLIINILLKDNWGRARPYQVIRDHKPFTYPWQPHFGNSKDNSFPSGHVSIGAFIGIPFIALRKKKLGISLSLAGTAIVGLVRFLQGGHYLSDILMAAIITWLTGILVTIVVDKYLLRSHGNNPYNLTSGK